MLHTKGLLGGLGRSLRGAFVQSWSAADNAWLKIHVASGEVVGQSAQVYADLDEVDPMDPGKPEPVTVSDPLGDFR